MAGHWLGAKMEKVETPINGLFVIKGKRYQDDRGVSTKCYSRGEFREVGLTNSWDQTLHVSNVSEGTLRGMHWQSEPYPEAKLVQCLRGKVFDVAVDMRPDSATFGKWFGTELSSECSEIFYLAPGIAHGYVTLEAQSDLLYHIAGDYRPEAQRVLRWNDADIGIDWPTLPSVISERDAGAPSFFECNACQ